MKVRTSTGAAACFVLTLVALTIVAYWPMRRNVFLHHDDDEYITRNAVVKRGLTVEGVVLAFTKSYAANWHPLTWISHMIDVDLFGLDPRGHHFTSFAIHLSNALLLFFTLRAMTARAGPSFLVAALFAVHPLHVESVAWAAERKDVLCAFFWMLTMALYLRYARRPDVRRYIPMLFCFLLGLLSKAMVVTLPIVLLLLDYWPLGRSRSGTRSRMAATQALVLEKAPLFAAAALVGLITIKAQASGGAIRTLEAFPAAARIANAILTPIRYLGRTVWPVDLAVFYPFTHPSLADPRVLATGGFMIALSAAALLLRRQRPWLLTGWLWYLVTLLPVIGLVKIGEQAMADRYTYLPLVGIFVAGAWSLPRPESLRAVPRAALTAGTVLVLLLLTGLTRRQVALWRDTGTLFGHAARVTEGNWLAAYHIGATIEEDGDNVGALRHYRESVRMKGDFETSRLNLARSLERQGRHDDALDELRAAILVIPGSRKLRMTLALALRDRGRAGEMLDELRAAIKVFPEDQDFRMILAQTLAEERQDSRGSR